MEMNFYETIIHLSIDIFPIFILAIFASSLIDDLVPDHYFEKIFGSNKFSGILIASFIGSLIPICTCGMIPLALKLHKKGIHWQVICSFLVGGNACSIPALGLTVVMGWNVVWIRLIASVLFGVMVAYILGILAPKNFNLELKTISCCDAATILSRDKTSIAIRIRRILKDSFSLILKFFPWILAALVIAAYLQVSTHTSENGESSILVKTILELKEKTLYIWLAPFYASLVGFPFYFCAGTDVPISLELISFGVPLGTIISFMLSAPAVNLTSFMIYKQALGLNKAAVFTAVSIFTSTIIGIIINFF